MAKRTQKQTKANLDRHITPYEHHYGSPLWRAVDEALGALEANQDIDITTYRDLVVGLLCERVSQVGLVATAAESADETQGVEVLRALKKAGLVIKRSPFLVTQ